MRGRIGFLVDILEKINFNLFWVILRVYIYIYNKVKSKDYEMLAICNDPTQSCRYCSFWAQGALVALERIY